MTKKRKKLYVEAMQFYSDSGWEVSQWEMESSKTILRDQIEENAKRKCLVTFFKFNTMDRKLKLKMVCLVGVGIPRRFRIKFS